MDHDTSFTNQTFKTVGTRVNRPDGVDKVTGRARYGADATAPGQLVGLFLRSPHAHAKITKLDVSKAEKIKGVKAVISKSFERIHRSNLIGMGVLPLQFLAGVTRETLGLTGDELISLTGLSSGITPGMTVKATFAFADGRSETVNLLARIDTDGEADYFKNGGILHYVLRQLAA